MSDEIHSPGAHGDGDALRIVVPRYGATVVGGAESAMRNLAHALSARNWRVSVWTTTAADEATWTSGFAPGVEDDDGVEVRRFRVALRRHPGVFRQLSRAAYHLPRPLAPDHAWTVAQGPYAPSLVSALARSEPVPTLFSPYLFHPTLYGLPASPHPRLLVPAAHDEPALRLRVVRRAILSAGALWYHSEEERDLLLSVHPEAASLPSRCGVVAVDAPHGVDRTAFARRHRVDGPYLYFGGRAAAGKGVADLLAAVERLHATHPSVQLVLSGEAVADASRPWVHAMGRLSDDERWEAIAGATAVVVPGALESLSLLALEAWSVGRPCLLNGASAVLAGHALRGGGGLTFSGAADLAEQTRRLIDDPARADAMGAAGRDYVSSTYSWDLSEHRLRALLGEART